MTRKVYKTAMGRTVDLGALLLQNEQVRAVGNMGVNAAGDLLDSTNRVIDQRNRQVQRQYKKQSNVNNQPVLNSSLAAKKAQEEANRRTVAKVEEDTKAVEQELDLDLARPETATKAETEPPKTGGLAAAIARSKEIKQELEKTRRQQEQEKGLRKI